MRRRSFTITRPFSGWIPTAPRLSRSSGIKSWPPIQPGSTGPRVGQLQRGLAELGYEVGTIDGEYGPSTAEAIEAFQTDAGLDADGIAGAATIRAINRELRERAQS